MPNRYLCDVLREMRRCYEHRDFSYLPALIEEAQWMGNRMEAGLYEHSDYRAMKEETDKVRKALEKHREEARAAKEALEALKAELKKLNERKRTLMALVHQFQSVETKTKEREKKRAEGEEREERAPRAVRAARA